VKFFQLLLVVSLLTGFASVVAFGQRQPPPIQSQSSALDRMIPPDLQKRLDLSNEQRRRLAAVAQRTESEWNRIAAQKLEPGQQRSRMEALMKRSMGEVRAILNERQRRIFDQEVKAAEARAARSGKQSRLLTKAEKRVILGLNREAIERMNLSQNQLSQIDVVADRIHQEFERNNRQRLSPQELRTRTESILKRAKDEVRRILNPNQRRIYEQVLKDAEKRMSEMRNRGNQLPPPPPMPR
jgi:hypothetical protein